MGERSITHNQKARLSLSGRILHAARELFSANGYYATTTRQIASEAGTSESGIFRLFKNKYEVLMAIYNDCWKEVNDAIEERLPNDCPDPRQQILNILRALWELYDERPLLMSFIIINTGNTDTLIIDRKDHAIISDENLRYIDRLESLCQQCKDQGLIPCLTVHALREGLLGISEGILLGWYLADKTTGRYPVDKVTVDDALDVVVTLLYGNIENKPGDL